MKKFNKVFGVVLSIIIVLGFCLSSCSQPAKQTESSSSINTNSTKSEKIIVQGMELSDPGVYPFVKEPGKVELELMMVRDPMVLDYETNEFTKFLESKTNIKLKFTLLTQADANQKLSILLNGGGDLPDVFWGLQWGNPRFFTTANVQTYGEKGLVIPLNDLLSKWAVNFKSLCADIPDAKQRITSLDGKIYGLPEFRKEPQVTMALYQRLSINTDFLSALGMKTPTTLDELYNYWKAVKEKDPNKDGKKDEIPLTGSISAYGNVDGFIMSAFILNDSKERLLLSDNGKIDVAYNKQEWKDGLKFLNKLCSEGLLDPAAFTQTEQQVKQIVEKEGPMLVGSVASFGPSNFADMNGERVRKYIPIAPVKGPNGVQITPYDKYSNIDAGLGFLISKDCKIPEIAVRFADIFLSSDPQTGFFNRYGVLGRDWDIPAAGTTSLTGGQVQYRVINNIWGIPQNVHWESKGIRYATFQAYDRDRLPADKYDSEQVFYKAALEYLPYAPKNPVPPILFTNDESKRQNELSTNLQKYVNESMARFAIGDLNIDAQWNNYLTELDKIGLKEYLVMEQKAYDRQSAIK